MLHIQTLWFHVFLSKYVKPVLVKHPGPRPLLTWLSVLCPPEQHQMLWADVTSYFPRICPAESRWCHPLVCVPPPSLAWPMCCGASNQTNVGRLGQLNRTSTHTLRGSALWRPRQLRQTESSAHYTLRHTDVCKEEPFHLLYPWNHIWKKVFLNYSALPPPIMQPLLFPLNYLCPGIKLSKLSFVLKQRKGDHQQIFYKKCVSL